MAKKQQFKLTYLHKLEDSLIYSIMSKIMEII